MSLRIGFWGCVRIVLVVGICLLFLSVISFVGWYQYADRGGVQVTDTINRLRAENLPVDNASIAAWYERRSDPTHTDAWLKILAQLTGKEFQSLLVRLEGFDLDSQETAWKPTGWTGESKAREILAATKDLRQEIRTLARERTPVRFPIQFASLNTDMSTIKAMNTLSHLVRLEFDAGANDRNSDDIAEASQTMLDLGMACSEIPGVHSHIVCVGIRQLGLESLKLALENNLLDDRALDRFAFSLPKERLELKHFAEIIQGERGLLLPLFLEPRANLGNGLAKSSYGLIGDRAANQDLLHFLDLMARLEAMDVGSLDTAIASSKIISKELDRDLQEAGYLNFREWYVTRSIVPPFEFTTDMCCYESILQRQILHAIAIRQYQRKHDVFPSDLGALKEVGFDALEFMPPGGKPMGYRRDLEEAILWSTSMQDGNSTSDIPPDVKKRDHRSYRREQLLWKFVR